MRIRDPSPALHGCVHDCTYLEVKLLGSLKQASSGLKNTLWAGVEVWYGFFAPLLLQC